MDFKAAIAALKRLDADNVDELASAIEGHVARLEEKSYETIGESRKNASKARAMQATVEAIAKVLGVEGEADVLAETLEAKAKEAFDGLASAVAKLTEAESRASAAEAKITSLERQGRIEQIAAKTGADPKVLQRLLSEQIDQIEIDGDAVKLGDKNLKEYIEADAELKAFMPALFPAQPPEQASQKPEASAKTTPQLPSGGPGGKPETKDPVAAYMSRTYTGAKAFSKAAGSQS